ncbi:hypothetical protein PIROE2DRAFT_10470 [Piromyces sp. E2]|nr:hypothetical protein PIROE2DRAFT_10470 [Piromyces sp. E2]|eukprot:OUM63062.1 hypothetical protein PIROE2DRAFT_10470 [Piromyces sp. E2]
MAINLLSDIKENFNEKYLNNESTGIAYDSASGECKYINRWLGKKENSDCCFIDGITCEDNHITRFIVENGQLSGSIPSEIGNLKYVRDLWLGHNKITGTIPPEIGDMTSLKDL